MTAYLAGVQERLRRAELERVEERARRRLTTVAAAAVILLGLLGGGGYAWNQRQRAERLAKTARAVDEALADASRLLGEARSAPPGDAGRWSAAVAAAKRAEGLLAQGEADDLLRRRVDSLVSEVERDRSAAAEKARQIEVDRVLLEELESVRASGSRVTNPGLKRTDADYAEAFRKAGLDLDATRPDEAGKWLASRTDPIELAGYIDDWAFVRRAAGRPESDWRQLVAAARGGDPDPWRDALRAKFGSNAADARCRVRPHGRRSQAGGPGRARTLVAGTSAQVRLRRRRAGCVGLAEGRPPLPGRLPDPFRAGPRPRPAAGRAPL